MTAWETFFKTDNARQIKLDHFVSLRPFLTTHSALKTATNISFFKNEKLGSSYSKSRKTQFSQSILDLDSWNKKFLK